MHYEGTKCLDVESLRVHASLLASGVLCVELGSMLWCSTGSRCMYCDTKCKSLNNHDNGLRF